MIHACAFFQNEDGTKTEYRVWNPFRSKLAAAILGGVDNIWIVCALFSFSCAIFYALSVFRHRKLFVMIYLSHGGIPKFMRVFVLNSFE